MIMALLQQGMIRLGGSYDSYKAAMKDPWKGWWVAWPPTQRVCLGDVFDTSDGNLRRAGDLVGRAIGFDSVAGTPAASFTYDSEGSVSTKFKLAGSVPQGFSALTEMDAGALVEFTGEASVLVLYDGLTQEGFSDIRSVAADLARLYWAGRWDTGLVAVSDVVAAAAGTVLTAERRGASAELRVTASAAAGPVSLIDLAGNVSVARSTSVGMHWAGPDVTPFYRVVRLRKTWLAGIKTAYGSRQPGRGAAPGPVPPLVIDEARDDPAAVLESVTEDEQPPGAGDAPAEGLGS
jgi:hypothetical protein